MDLHKSSVRDEQLAIAVVLFRHIAVNYMPLIYNNLVFKEAEVFDGI